LTATDILNANIEKTKAKFREYRLAIQSIQRREDAIPPDLEDCTWCNKCYDYYKHCQTSINTNEIETLGGKYLKQITYICRSKNHIFTVSSLRKNWF